MTDYSETAPPPPPTPASDADVPAAVAPSKTTRPTKKGTGAAKRTTSPRPGQVSVILGDERHARLKEVWALNASKYERVADLVRDAIDEKLDQLERGR